MGSQRKNKALRLKRTQYETLCLIKEGMLGSCTHLMNEKERIEVVNTGKLGKDMIPYPFTFCPEASDEFLSQVKKGDTLDLLCDDECVGELKVESKFNNDKNTTDIFSPNMCSIEEIGDICISGEFELFNSHIKELKTEFEKVKQKLNAKSITAIISSFDPLHRGHERIMRWTIDKADLVVIFLIESYETRGLNFELKLTYLKKFIQEYIPQDRVFIFPLKNIDLFHAHLNPSLEAIIAKNLGCTKLVVGQNHTGLGMFYDKNRPKTILDEFSENHGIEVVVLPEFVFCDQCRVFVSTRSCPHGTHHHIKFNSNALKDLLRLGILPPPVLMRREISCIILSELFPDRFKNMQRLYNELFATREILEYRKDEEFYTQLLNLYQIAYMV